VSTDITESINRCGPGVPRSRVNRRFRFDANTVGLSRRTVGVANGRLRCTVETTSPFDGSITSAGV
jgi:hypothetical protein